MSLYHIESGLVSPDSTRFDKYPFGKMEVGDSFALPSKESNRVSMSATQYFKRHGARFTVRKVDSETHRCWRVS